MQTPPSAESPNPVTSVSLFFVVQKWGYLHKGNLYPAFRQIRGGQRTLPASVDSHSCFQLKITLNINAKVVCLGVATLIPFSSKQ